MVCNNVVTLWVINMVLPMKIGCLQTLLLSAVVVSVMSSCGSARSGGGSEDGMASVDSVEAVADFNSDSAYEYVRRQVAFGPRVSGSAAAAECAGWLESELARHGATDVRLQRGVVTAFNGDRLEIANVMGAYNAEARDRVLLVAHYDSRPWADADDREELRMRPVPGANDGASGVGVILEIARLLGQRAPRVGVDVLFVDAEDYGQSSGFSTHDESWALGTQYWAVNMPYAEDSLPRYALLLDMVGGLGAKFHREYFSNQAAPDVVDRVWSIAERSGYGSRFVNVEGGAVVDDHIYLNRAGIRAIDIIESKNDATRSFNPTWHTANDNMSNIDRSTLKVVGQTVLNVIYNE